MSTTFTATVQVEASSAANDMSRDAELFSSIMEMIGDDFDHSPQVLNDLCDEITDEAYQVIERIYVAASQKRSSTTAHLTSRSLP